MKRFLIAAFTSISLLYIAQTQVISFEAAEGYTVGNLGGQQGWTTWGGLPPANAQVAISNATNGTNSFTMTSSSLVHQACGIEKDITSLVTGQDVEISFDYSFSGLNSSSYEIAVYNSTTVSDYTAALRINHLSGNLSYRTASSFVNGPDLLPNQYYNFKIVIRQSDDTLEYFVNGTSVFSGALGTFKNAEVLDFVYDDFGSGFSVDNIQITNLGSLSTQEAIVKDDFKIYPNPVAENLYIKAASKIVSIKIADMGGRIIKNISGIGNAHEQQISVADLISGTYIINVKTETSHFSKKFIKK